MEIQGWIIAVSKYLHLFYLHLFSALLQEEKFPGWRSTTVLGLLDIYGFEVFQHNRFVLINSELHCSVYGVFTRLYSIS